MASFWKKAKKFFEKGKKKSASETVKAFQNSKESWEKEIAEKTPDLHPKVVEIYRSSTTIITKKLLKAPTEPAIKENPGVTQSILADLAKAGFPGAQLLSDAGVKVGPALIPGPIVALFEKTSTFLVEEPLPEEPRDVPTEVTPEEDGGASGEKKEETSDEKKEEETSGEKKEEVIVEKKEEVIEVKKEEVIEEKKEEVIEGKKEEVSEVKKEEVGDEKKEASEEEKKEETREVKEEVIVVAHEVKEEVIVVAHEVKEEVIVVAHEAKEEVIAVAHEAKEEVVEKKVEVPTEETKEVKKAEDHEAPPPPVVAEKDELPVKGDEDKKE